uniref:CMP/dCMP-type deaminase domain-containing protein n=1 Tax=Salvator merianae TaxID=96440 RepID=A0A8D0BIC1_SALMN
MEGFPFSPTFVFKAPKCTYLLYEFHWGRRRRIWRNWCKNNASHHAEINFLQNACETIKERKTTPCHITWFLSWSPCASCCRHLIKFLKDHPNVTLEIKAAMLFRHHAQCNQSGLRALVNHGVQISIMQVPEEQSCKQEIHGF